MTGTIITSVQKMQATALDVRARGKTIGLVPTMGALHDGHLALIRKAKSVADWVVTSVFVNPTQFGPGEDYGRYPRDLDRDAALASAAGSDVIFAPGPSEMYPKGFETFVVPGGVAEVLEGRTRPGHFRGVGTVVTKLLNITMPHVAVFGQKDAQQAFIVRRLVRDLNMNVTILVEPTVRETDGLAMSSRNAYLAPDERSRATCIVRALGIAEARIQSGERSADALRKTIEREIEKGSPTGIDYVAILNADTFEEENPIVPPSVVIAVAVRFGATRLIDNMIITVPG